MQLSVEINFISLKSGSDETRVMYTRSDNEEFMSDDDTNEYVPMVWREQNHYCRVCYVFLTKTSVFNKKNKDKIEYPYLPRAIRPKSHS